MPDEKPPVPVVYVTDAAYNRFDPADLFDIAYLLRSPAHDLCAVCLTDGNGSGERIVNELALRANVAPPALVLRPNLSAFFADASEPLNVVAVGGYNALAAALNTNRAVFRQAVARLFLVGGHVNEYREGVKERLPTDPRLRARHPERFAPTGDGRVLPDEARAFGQLLTSGEGVIWVPRDISLWRYAAPGVLEDGGPLCAFLLRELFWHHLQAAPNADRYEVADAPVLLSALPALLLAVEPDPFAWMRLFRVIAARVEGDENGRVLSFVSRTDAPNLYALVAIDGQALGKLLTARLRDRPLTT